MLHCCRLENLNFWTKGPGFSCCTEPCKLCNGSCLYNLNQHPYRPPLCGQVVKKKKNTCAWKSCNESIKSGNKETRNSNYNSPLVLSYYVRHCQAVFPFFPHSSTAKATFLLQFYSTGNWAFAARKLACTLWSWYTTESKIGQKSVVPKLLLHQNCLPCHFLAGIAF